MGWKTGWAWLRYGALLLYMTATMRRETKNWERDINDVIDRNPRLLEGFSDRDAWGDFFDEQMQSGGDWRGHLQSRLSGRDLQTMLRIGDRSEYWQKWLDRARARVDAAEDKRRDR